MCSLQNPAIRFQCRIFQQLRKKTSVFFSITRTFPRTFQKMIKSSLAMTLASFPGTLKGILLVSCVCLIQLIFLRCLLQEGVNTP